VSRSLRAATAIATGRGSIDQYNPHTPAGAAALIQHAIDEDLSTDEKWWHMTALRSAVAALNSMGA